MAIFHGAREAAKVTLFSPSGFPWLEPFEDNHAAASNIAQSWCLARYSCSLLANTQTENRLMVGAVPSYAHSESPLANHFFQPSSGFPPHFFFFPFL